MGKFYATKAVTLPFFVDQHRSFGSTGAERGTRFVVDMNPFDGFETPQSIGEAVQRVAHHTVNALDARLGEGLRM
jgi:hypothetical protein